VIPDFDETGNLPPGFHQATWQEIVEKYGHTANRKKMLEGLKRALGNLKQAGCECAYLDGSFITSKRKPGDFDLCWEVDGVDGELLDPILRDREYLLTPRAEQRSRYFGDILPTRKHPKEWDLLSFFQFDKHTNQQKGIIVITMGLLP
jgi:hypothetical protein